MEDPSTSANGSDCSWISRKKNPKTEQKESVTSFQNAGGVGKIVFSFRHSQKRVLKLELSHISMLAATLVMLSPKMLSGATVEKLPVCKCKSLKMVKLLLPLS